MIANQNMKVGNEVVINKKKYIIKEIQPETIEDRLVKVTTSKYNFWYPYDYILECLNEASENESAVKMRETIEITGIIDGVKTGYIKKLLENAGVSLVKIKTQPYYYDWIETLPKESMPGLAEQCIDWIHSWGNGGGDYSSETCITDAIRALKSDVPASLADAIYSSVVDYSKSDFEAMGLTMELINGSIDDIESVGE